MSIYGEILGPLLIRERNTEKGRCALFTADSRHVRPGMGFVAVPGNTVDGHDFVPAALAAGAALIVTERELPLPPGTPTLLVREGAASFALLCRASFGNPDEALTLLGVTGTNGKTTTAFLLEHIFNFARIPCGLVSTVTYRTGKRELPGDRTTPDSATLFSLFSEMKSAGLKSAAMEFSSHALDQNRAAGVLLRAGIFTNLTGDHLDYHGDMEHYFQAKKKLFTHFLREDGIAVINGEDPWGRRLAAELPPRVRIALFGLDEKFPCRITEVQFAPAGVKFRLAARAYGELAVSSNLPGAYNVLNLAGAALAALDCGIAPETVAAALERKIRVPGRLESFPLPGGAAAFVDYAHTDDALTNVLRAVRGIVPGRIITVFGAGGNRDRTKRPRMGKAAAALSDMLFVTSDNPRNEDPDAIIGEILAGVPEGTPCRVIRERAEALRQALGSAENGDAVVIAGKGHEEYQEIKGVKHHFSDIEEVRKFISTRES